MTPIPLNCATVTTPNQYTSDTLYFVLLDIHLCIQANLVFSFGCSRLGFRFLVEVFWEVSIHLVPALMMDQEMCKNLRTRASYCTQESFRNVKGVQGVSDLSKTIRKGASYCIQGSLRIIITGEKIIFSSEGVSPYHSWAVRFPICHECHFQ